MQQLIPVLLIVEFPQIEIEYFKQEDLVRKGVDCNVAQVATAAEKAYPDLVWLIPPPSGDVRGDHSSRRAICWCH